MVGAAGAAGEAGTGLPAVDQAGAGGLLPNGQAGTAPGAMGDAGMTGTAGAAGAAGLGEAGVGGAPASDGSVPAGDYCASVADWDPAWVAFEDEVLRLTNQYRASGANCDTQGNFGPAPALTTNPMLRCAARLHSMDMGVQGYFDHVARDGRDPFKRMGDAGYVGSTMGENIAKGQQSPQEVVAGWIDSDGHCANIMRASFTEIGVGYWEGLADNRWFNGNKLWTQNFGAPRASFPRR
jgi:uncharacterized protein YkwD